MTQLYTNLKHWINLKDLRCFFVTVLQQIFSNTYNLPNKSFAVLSINDLLIKLLVITVFLLCNILLISRASSFGEQFNLDNESRKYFERHLT